MMSAEELATLKGEIEGLKLALAKKEKEAQVTAENLGAVEQELKHVIKQPKSESVKGEGVVYVTQSRKLERFRGRPVKTSDPTVEEWIEDAKASSDSKGLTKEQSALYLVEHLAGEARREILGRGDGVKGDPEQIYAVLLRVFGDGDSLPQLQQQFFSYRQKEGEDLVSLSLHLVQLFDRIVQLDSSFKPGRDSQLKNRLAEAVRDDSARTELRRLNTEHPELSYFDARDRVMKLMSTYGKPEKSRQTTLVQEAAADQDVHSILKQQSQQIATQQKQIESLVAALSVKNVPPRGSGSRRCWECDSSGHLRRDCPNRGGNTEAATPAAQTQGKNLN